MANFVSAEDMRRIAQHIRSMTASPDADLVERIGKIEVYDDDGNLMFSASPDGSKIRVATGEFNSKEVSAEIPFKKNGQDLEYLPFTVSADGETFVVTVETADTDSDFPYRATVHRASCSTSEEWWTLEGKDASGFFLIASLSEKCSYVRGKIVIPSQDEYGMFLMEYDLAARETRRLPFPADDLPKDVDEVEHVKISDGCMFERGTWTERTEYGRDIEHQQVFLLSERLFVRLLPEDAYEIKFLGEAVHGGFAYVAFSAAFFTFVLRIDLSSGAAASCFFYGTVLPADGFDKYEGLMVDGDFITLFGTCRFFKTESEAAEPFVGAARIPLGSAEWTAFLPGDSPATAAPSTPMAYRMSAAAEDELFVPCPGFLDAGELAAVRMKNVGENLTRAEVLRLAFSDGDAPESMYNAVVRGALVPREVASYSANANDDWERYYSMMYKIQSFAGQYGAAFPVMAAGLPAVVSAHLTVSVIPFAGIMEYGFEASTIFDEERSEATGSGVHAAGVGFSMIARDVASGKSRYYLDTGAYIEFNEDGTLTAQTGAQGPRGAAGRDGRDGKDGATPEISLSATVDGGSGEPYVEVARSGTAERPEFSLEFGNLKGERGEKGEKGDDGKDGTLSIDEAQDAEIDDAGYAVGSKNGTLTRTLWSKVWNWIKNKIENTFMALKGSSLTMTGSIVYKGSKSSNNMIVFMDNTADANGNGIAIGGGGMTVVGGGESANLFRNSSGSEQLILANDANIEFYSNCQNGTGSAKKMIFDTSGNLEVPGQVLLPARSGMWIYGRDNAALRQKTASVLWAPIMSIKSKSGSFDIGSTSENDNLYVRYATDANYSAKNNSTTDVMTISTGGMSVGVKIYANAGIRIPTSQPANLENGMIWIT